MRRKEKRNEKKKSIFKENKEGTEWFFVVIEERRMD